MCPIGQQGTVVQLALVAHVNGREDVVADAVSGLECIGRVEMGAENTVANLDQEG